MLYFPFIIVVKLKRLTQFKILQKSFKCTTEIAFITPNYFT